MDCQGFVNFFLLVLLFDALHLLLATLSDADRPLIRSKSSLSDEDCSIVRPISFIYPSLLPSLAF